MKCYLVVEKLQRMLVRKHCSTYRTKSSQKSVQYTSTKGRWN